MSENREELPKVSKGVFTRLLKYIKPYWKTVAACLLLVVITSTLELYRPQLIGNAIDKYISGTFQPGEQAEMRFAGLMKSAGIYLAILLILLVCNRAQFMMLQKTGQRVVYAMRQQLFEHMEKLTMRFFDVTPVGKIVTRITNDVEQINRTFTNLLVNLVKNIFMIAGLAIVMLILNTRMALYCFILVPVVAVMSFVFRYLMRRVYQVMRTRITAINVFLSEHLSGMKVIQIFNREEAKHKQYCEKSNDLYQSTFKEIILGAVFRPSFYLLSIIALAIVLGLGGTNVLDGTISIGTLYVFVEYIQRFFDPIIQLADQFTSLQSALASAEKIFTFLDEKPQVTDSETPKKLTAVKGKIEFDHVWFAYDNENYVLKDVSFTIEPGQKVAFVGATGAGKSSILNLIGRYYDIQKGSIRIDGVDIRELTREQIRSSIGQVQQDVFVFTGDIKSNIRLRDEQITDEEIVAAAEHTNASHFIEKLPCGYNERVSERGATFSAGQRQLLSFARTLAHDPKILILDEATANIDTETEQWIQEALEHLMEGRTTIMVAHRLSTIQHADKIIVMHHGRIRETGTHQELLDMNGIYKKLYQLQLA